MEYPKDIELYLINQFILYVFVSLWIWEFLINQGSLSESLNSVFNSP